MRVDDIGLFWENAPQARRGEKIARIMPPIPDTGWTPPTSFPNLASAACISVDCETYDPELLDNGPGWARGKGHIVGVAVGADGGGRWYFPIRHTIEPEQNLDPVPVMAWLRDALANPQQPKVGANIMYDVGWLKHEGVAVRGELVDVQYAEALLDERAHVALEVLAQKYLGEGKISNLLYQWCSDFYGGKIDGGQRANIYRAPPRLVGPYAESDADLPLRLARVMYPHLVREGMVDLFKMECGLIPLLVEMRFAGVTVNIPRAEQLRDSLLIREGIEHAKIKEMVGFHVDINAADSLAKAFDSLGIPYSKTQKGRPSFTKDFLKDIVHPLGKRLNEVRKLAKLRGTFVESYILGSHINGKVHGQFHPLRSDSNGTRSGRLASSNPNLQNIPVRDEELAPIIRGLFGPDPEHLIWRREDYSQIEYRFLIHFAIGPMADDVRRIFNEAPDTDYHDMTRDLIQAQTGQLLDRRPVKNINFGLIFGMGVDKLSHDLGLTLAKGKELFKAYHVGMPFVKPTMDATMQEARDTGVITTILGRKSRFDLWEPAGWGFEGVALPYERAILTYGHLQRAYVHKALNRRLQGSAADLMKLAMLRCWQDGVFDETGVPRLTVHDELDFSDPGGKDKAFAEVHRILETCLPIRIPIKAICEVGPDWGHTEKVL